MDPHASAVTALARFGSAAKGDPIYDAAVQLGELLRTACLADYFANAGLRRELRRVLNRGEAVNALTRAIYTDRIAPAQARRVNEMPAVADALRLLANIAMALNTAQMQAVFDRWANRHQIVPSALTGRIAPTRLEGINLRGVVRFPLERYAGQILPSQTAAKTSTGGGNRPSAGAACGAVGRPTENQRLTSTCARQPVKTRAVARRPSRYFLHRNQGGPKAQMLPYCNLQSSTAHESEQGLILDSSTAFNRPRSTWFVRLRCPSNYPICLYGVPCFKI